MGASCSPTVVYLVATNTMTASETLTHVRSLRGIVWPNEAFCQQLEKYGARFVKAQAVGVCDASAEDRGLIRNQSEETGPQ